MLPLALVTSRAGRAIAQGAFEESEAVMSQMQSQDILTINAGGEAPKDKLLFGCEKIVLTCAFVIWLTVFIGIRDIDGAVFCVLGFLITTGFLRRMNREDPIFFAALVTRLMRPRVLPVSLSKSGLEDPGPIAFRPTSIAFPGTNKAAFAASPFGRTGF